MDEFVGHWVTLGELVVVVGLSELAPFPAPFPPAAAAAACCSCSRRK